MNSSNRAIGKRQTLSHLNTPPLIITIANITRRLASQELSGTIPSKLGSMLNLTHLYVYYMMIILQSFVHAALGTSGTNFKFVQKFGHESNQR